MTVFRKTKVSLKDMTPTTPTTPTLEIVASIMSFLLTVTLLVALALPPSSTPLIPSASTWTRISATSDDARQLSYEGDDVPIFHSLSDLPNARATSELSYIRATFEESVHFTLEDPESEKEWLQTSPYGSGIIRLGPHNRTFVVAMFHEIHCLRNFRDAYIASRDNTDWGHVQHCLNYVRQLALCSADVTLERGDFMMRDFATERTGETHVC
ncbi:hypothetical protein OF83DRAFT_706430 [Amylostereum chailletii]|nr:hypothetical protein OF83DRAFT_706430 [Amylostereum chailletii]